MVSISFYPTYSEAKLVKLGKKPTEPVSLICEVVYSHSMLTHKAARAAGHKIHELKFSTSIKVPPGLFDRQRVRQPTSKLPFRNWQTANADLDQLEKKIQMLHRRFCEAGTFPGKKEFRAVIESENSLVTAERDFFADWQLFIDVTSTEKMRAKLATSNPKKIAMDKFRAFADANLPYIKYDQINQTVGAQYVAWLSKQGKRNGQPYKRNSVNNLVDGLKGFLAYAKAEEWHSSSLFENIGRQKVTAGIPEILTGEELLAFASATAQNYIDLNLPLITRDWFVLASQTGIRTVDWDWSKMKLVQKEGNYTLIYQQQKTGWVVEVPLSKLAVEVLRRNNWQMGRASSIVVKLDHINRLANNANIGKKVTTHTARRTFASTAEIEWGFPRSFVMRLGGWKTETSYLKYLGIALSQNLERALALRPDIFKIDG